MSKPTFPSEATALAVTGSAQVTSWAATSPQREKVEASLWYWNASMATLHGVQAVAVLAASQVVAKLSAFKIPMMTSYTDWTFGYPMPALQKRADMPFVAVTSAFAFMSAAAHLIVLARFEHYKAGLRRGRNLYRWYEYAASSSLMIGLIAQLFGVYDVNALVAIMSVNA